MDLSNREINRRLRSNAIGEVWQGLRVFPTILDLLIRAIEIIRSPEIKISRTAWRNEAQAIAVDPESNIPSQFTARRCVNEAIGRWLRQSGYDTQYIDHLSIDMAWNAVLMTNGLWRELTGESLSFRYFTNGFEEFVAEFPISDRNKGRYRKIRGAVCDKITQDIDRILEMPPGSGVSFGSLCEELQFIVAARLRDIGVGEAEAARIASSAVRDFKDATEGEATEFLLNPKSTVLAAQLAGCVSKAILLEPHADFNGRAKLALPPKAPKLWKNKEDREPGETPDKFLRRVWGAWLDAELLYQDDLPNLGEDKLCPAIRSYCQRTGQRAAELLPPPRHLRTDRALAAAAEGSLQRKALTRTVRDRQRMARKREPGSKP